MHNYKYSHAIAWFNLAIDRLTDGTLGNVEQSRGNILGFLGYSLYMNGRYLTIFKNLTNQHQFSLFLLENYVAALAVIDEILLNDPENENAIKNRNTILNHINLLKNKPPTLEEKV